MKIEITDTAYEGYGVGRVEDGRVIFIPFTVEGDVVEAEITEEKKKFCYGRLVEIIKPSERRTESWCEYASVCGGCSFGHINYEDQLEIKERILKNSLSRSNGYEGEIEVHSGEPKRYRNRARFKIEKGSFGFFKFMTNELLPVEDCPVVKESIVEKVREFAEANADLNLFELYVVENDKGEIIASTRDLEEEAEGLDIFDGFKSNIQSYGRKSIDFVTEFGEVKAGYGTFLQSNRHLFSEFQSSADIIKDKDVLELYCGAGFFTTVLAKNNRRVKAVDYQGASIRLGKSSGQENVKWVAKDVDGFVRSEKGSYDVLVVDPPRAGLSKQVISFIKKNNFSEIYYVSCNPQTLSRDSGRLKDVYNVESVKLFDMFPGTHHIETVIVLKRVDK